MIRPKSDKNKNGIDSIAHLFLSQSARNCRDQSSRTRKHPIIEPERIVLAYHLDDPYAKLRGYAKVLGNNGDKVVLVSLDDCEAQLLPLSEGKTAHGADQSIVFAETEDIHEKLVPAIAGAIGGLDDCGAGRVHVLINIDASFRYRGLELLDYYRELTMITTCQSQDVIETYKVLKDWSEYLGDLHKVSLFVCDAADSEAGDEVYYKLANAGKKFLNRVLIPAGCSMAAGDLTPAEPEAALEETEAVDEQLPGEDDIPAETLELEEDIVDGDKTESVNTDVCAEKLQFFDSVVNSPQTLYPIQVVSLPQDDVQLSNYLQLALPRWLTTVPTAMAIPLSLPRDIGSSVRVLIDATGRVHVLSAGLCASGDIINRGLAAYKWLSNNLTSIAGACRQLKIDLSAPAGLILVAGGVAETMEIAMDELNERELPEPISCQIMKLYFLQNETESALLIMPV
jgi:hypothetical protein